MWFRIHKHVSALCMKHKYPSRVCHYCSRHLDVLLLEHGCANSLNHTRLSFLVAFPVYIKSSYIGVCAFSLYLLYFPHLAHLDYITSQGYFSHFTLHTIIQKIYMGEVYALVNHLMVNDIQQSLNHWRT